jgi:hypothetical protein
LSVVAFFAVVIAWFTILFTGRYPRGLFDLGAALLKGRHAAFGTVWST